MEYQSVSTRSAAAVSSFALLFAFASTQAHAGPYTFRNVADTTGPFVSFHQDPALNNAGTVALTAVTADGGNALLRVSADGSIATLDAVGNLGLLSDPSINDAGDVAFIKRDPVLDRQSVALANTAGGVVTVADNDTAGPYRNFISPPSINDAGEVVFEAALNAGGTTILRGTGPAAVDTVIDDAGPFDLFGFPSANNTGAVATSARFDDGRSGIIIVDRGGAITVIADDAGPYNLFDEPAINNSGAIAFQASDDSARAGIFTGADSLADAVARESDGYAFPSAGGAVDINNAGTVAFLAITLDDMNPNLPTPEEGIFTGPDPAADKVVRAGDSLFGSAVADVSFSPGGLNDRGEIAFYYALEDGSSGVAVATPVPLPAAAPTALAALAVLAPAVAARILKRRRGFPLTATRVGAYTNR